jgi:hypothetical protein
LAYRKTTGFCMLGFFNPPIMLIVFITYKSFLVGSLRSF